MKKATINMLSSATKIRGQGVGSAYIEQVNLVRSGLSKEFDIFENKVMQADITHYHTIDLKFALSQKALSKRGRSVGYVHMLPETVEQSIDLPAPMKKVFFWYMIRFYKLMDHLVTVNPYFIGELAKYGVPREKVTYIPNFVSEADFHPLNQNERRTLCRKYHLDEARFTVVCAGQLQHRKSVLDFVEIAKRMPDVQFVWAGGFSFGVISDGYKEIDKLVKNPPANVRFLGIIDRDLMNEIYNVADVMFLPSFEELFPMTILEAMCAHVPILLRDLDIYPNILFDFYYRENSVDGFVAQLTRLKEDPDYYEEGVQNAIRGNAFYARENVLEMWRTFYRKVLDTPAR